MNINMINVDLSEDEVQLIRNLINWYSNILKDRMDDARRYSDKPSEIYLQRLEDMRSLKRTLDGLRTS